MIAANLLIIKAILLIIKRNTLIVKRNILKLYPIPPSRAFATLAEPCRMLPHLFRSTRRMVGERKQDQRKDQNGFAGSFL